MSELGYNHERAWYERACQFVSRADPLGRIPGQSNVVTGPAWRSYGSRQYLNAGDSAGQEP
jgi:hypothetical protein